MSTWAKYSDGVEVGEDIFRVMTKYAPDGTMDVFASDQHNSYLKLTTAYLKHIGQKRPATDDDVREVGRRFARALGGISTAALFNRLVFESPGFRDILGKNVLLIGRLEDTNPISIDDGKGQLALLSIDPEVCTDKVDAFKTLIKLDPDHKESWEKNLDWLKDIFQRSQKLGKLLFNEVLMFQRPGESKVEMAKRLPEGLVRIAEDFGPYGHFYKTQVPVLWAEEDHKITKISSPKTIRATAEAMAQAVDRPMLLLSAAVDFEQYAAQFGIVADLFAGPMCGRAYFKESFTAEATKDWDSLETSFRRIALPRIQQIKNLAHIVSKPWWHKFSWMSDEARELINRDAKPKASDT